MTPNYSKEDLIYLMDNMESVLLKDPNVFNDDYNITDVIKKVLQHPSFDKVCSHIQKEKKELLYRDRPASYHIIEVIEEVLLTPLERVPTYLNPFPEEYGIPIIKTGRKAVQAIARWRLKIAK